MRGGVAIGPGQGVGREGLRGRGTMGDTDVLVCMYCWKCVLWGRYRRLEVVGRCWEDVWNSDSAFTGIALMNMLADLWM